MCFGLQQGGDLAATSLWGGGALTPHPAPPRALDVVTWLHVRPHALAWRPCPPCLVTEPPFPQAQAQ